MKNKNIKNCLYLAIIGDIIGYNNEFMTYKTESKKNKIIEIINSLLVKNENCLVNFMYYTRKIHFDFFKNYGGFNNYELKNKKVSNNSSQIIHMLNIKYYDKTKSSNIYQKTKQNVENTIFNSNKKINISFLFQFVVIGLFFSNKNNKNILISTMYEIFDAIYKLSNNSDNEIDNIKMNLFFGCLCITFLTFYAINKYNIKEWMIDLLDILKNLDVLDVKFKDDISYVKNRDIYIQTIEKYIFYKNPVFNDKFDNKMLFTDLRLIFYLENFSNFDYMYPGFKPLDIIIIAYDSLYDSKDNYELLVIYNMLYFGNSNFTGCLSSALYGAYYGKKNVPLCFIEKEFEYKKEIDGFLKKIN